MFGTNIILFTMLISHESCCMTGNWFRIQTRKSIEDITFMVIKYCEAAVRERLLVALKTCVVVAEIK